MFHTARLEMLPRQLNRRWPPNSSDTFEQRRVSLAHIDVIMLLGTISLCAYNTELNDDPVLVNTSSTE